MKHPDAIHDHLVLAEEHNLAQARIVACGDYLLFQGHKYLLFQGPEANPDVVTERPHKLWNWKSGELLVCFNDCDRT
jgi:hypothetical protein